MLRRSELSRSSSTCGSRLAAGRRTKQAAPLLEELRFARRKFSTGSSKNKIGYLERAGRPYLSSWWGAHGCHILSIEAHRGDEGTDENSADEVEQAVLPAPLGPITAVIFPGAEPQRNASLNCLEGAELNMMPLTDRMGFINGSPSVLRRASGGYGAGVAA